MLKFSIKIMLLIYITCESKKQAKKVGKALFKKRLAGCINIIPQITSIYFWPAKKGKLEEAREGVLIVKAKDDKFKAVEKKVCSLHPYNPPFYWSNKTRKSPQGLSILV